MTHLEEIERVGFAVLGTAVPAELLGATVDEFNRIEGRAGTRCALDRPSIAALAAFEGLTIHARRIVGPTATCVRAILFAKGPGANWKVRWHQDTVVSVPRRFDAPGWTAWSVKEGQVCVRPPVEVLERRLILRVDVDGSGPHNGGLRLVPGSHRHGVLDVEASRALRAAGATLTPEVPAGGALVMRPLLLHASAVSENDAPRRIVHLEFAPEEDQGPPSSDLDAR